MMYLPTYGDRQSAMVVERHYQWAVRIDGERSIISVILSRIGGRRRLILAFPMGYLLCYYLGRDFDN